MANGTNWSSRKNQYYVQWRRNRKQQPQQQQPQPAPAPPTPPQAAAPQQPPQPQQPQRAQQAAPQQQPQATPAQPSGVQLLRQLRTQFNNNPQGIKGSGVRLKGTFAPGYDANGNAALQKWQGQSDDTKAARFLAKTHNDIQMQGYDPSTGSYTHAVGANGQTYQDGYNFYQGDYQNFSLALGLNAKPTVLPDSQFNALVRQQGLQVLYRGEAGQSQVDRFMNSQYSHTGVGSYGDGFYFSDNKGTANSYANLKGGSSGRVLKMALSPNARIITYNDLQTAMAKAGVKLTSALNKQGRSAQGASYWNSGEAQFALKMGYNVIAACGSNNSDYHFALTRDAFIVSDKVKHNW